MNRLNFQLPDFGRHSWVNNHVKSVWEPRFGQIRSAWEDIEWLSTVEHLRKCAFLNSSNDRLLALSERFVIHKLAYLPVEIIGSSDAIYSSSPPKVMEGQATSFRVVVGSMENVVLFRQAWETNNDDQIGELLGYPLCCRNFYETNWVNNKFIDTTWPMTLNSKYTETAQHTVEVQQSPYANMLWRWQGLRLVPHLPCSFECAKTIQNGTNFLELGIKLGYDREMEWLLEILSWPVEWSALHGIAEIRTPVMKMVTRTDATADKYTIRAIGDRLPVDAVNGLSFPYSLVSLQQKTALSKALPATQVEKSSQYSHGNHLENGFSSDAAMQTAHWQLANQVKKEIAVVEPNILDLGCGNGALLEKIRELVPDAVVFGIDSDAGKILHAKKRLKSSKANFVTGNIFLEDDIGAFSSNFDLILVSINRFGESTPVSMQALKARLATTESQVLIYSYDHLKSAETSLLALCKLAGFSVLHTANLGNVSIATLQKNTLVESTI